MCVAPCRRLGSECSSWYFLHPVREPAAIGHHLVVGVCHGYRGALLIQCGLAPQGQRHRPNLRSESKPPGRLSGYRRLCPKRDVLPSWTRFQATSARPPGASFSACVHACWFCRRGRGGRRASAELELQWLNDPPGTPWHSATSVLGAATSPTRGFLGRSQTGP